MKKKTLLTYTLRILLFILGLGFFAFLASLLINLYMINTANSYIYSSPNDTPLLDSGVIIILGAQVHSNGNPSGILKDRLDTAYTIYKNNPKLKILVSGDHGHKNYDEVNAMKDYLINLGVGAKQIYLDHAGFSTYETMYRAKEIFEVNKAIIVTQDYHLKRAVYLANARGIDVYGVKADILSYRNINYFKAREYLACVKDFCYVLFNPKPTYLGDKIPIMSADSSLTYDKKVD